MSVRRRGCTSLRQAFLQPADADAVCAVEVPHCRVATGLADSNHGLVVLVELQHLLRLEDHIPQL